MSDTWGIPGPTFLWIFLGLAVLVLVGTLLHRRRLFDGPADVEFRNLPPAHLAYLAEGPQRAVYASLAFLRRENVVEVSDTGRMARSGGIPAGSSALDSAVLQAAGEGVRASQALQTRSVQAALADIKNDLLQRDLLLSGETRRKARTGIWFLLALEALGVARIVAGDGAKPVLFLVLLMVVLVVPIVVLLLRRPRLTKAAERGLAVMRGTHAHLTRESQPAWGTHDAMTTAVAVGLFGGAILWAADPAVAEAAAIRHTSTGWSGGTYVGDGGASSGDGGGGGGSSCGGGGGGGCGG